MKIFTAVSALLLVGLVTALPIDDNGALVINDSFFIEKYVVYRSENDITKIVVPINEINIKPGTDIDDFDLYVFFIEEGKGLYVFKDHVATKVLENGRDIGASMIDGSKDVFFAATDGIYTFNAEKKTAEKYGTLTDNIKSLVVANGTHEIYILTDNNVLYQVNEDGTDKTEISNVKNAEDIVLDAFNNLYYVDSKKDVYVRSYVEGTVKKIKGLPARTGSVKLLRAPPILGDCMPLIIGSKAYRIYADGHSDYALLNFASKPTAYAADAALVIYFAYDKKMYQYKYNDIKELEAQYDLENLESYVDTKAPALKEVVKKVKSLKNANKQ